MLSPPRVYHRERERPECERGLSRRDAICCAATAAKQQQQQRGIFGSEFEKNIFYPAAAAARPYFSEASSSSSSFFFKEVRGFKGTVSMETFVLEAAAAGMETRCGLLIGRSINHLSREVDQYKEVSKILTPLFKTRRDIINSYTITCITRRRRRFLIAEYIRSSS